MSTQSRSPTAEMSTLKTVSIVLAFTAAVGMVLGTAGFSAIDADRGIEVSVVDDESAYLSADQTSETIENGTETEVLTYENRFGTDLDEFEVDVSIANPSDTDAEITVADGPDGIGAGETEPVTVALQCDGEEPSTVTLVFEVDAGGDGVSLSTSDEREATCQSEE